ncbi:AMP-binding protein, partial [Actinophytocola gossypii]
MSLVSRFGVRVGSTPDAVAIEDSGRFVTYGQLDRWSDAVCAELVAVGVVPGGLVGVLLPRDSRWIAAILGVLKAGCGYVPMDPLYPVERLTMMASDSAVSVVLGESSGTDPASGLPCVAVPAPTASVRSTTQPLVGLDSPAYVIYTSGSTGRPKGVPIRHRNVLALIDAAQSRMDFGSTDVWSLFHSFSFDFSVWEMWGPLLTGARIVLVPQDARLDP